MPLPWLYNYPGLVVPNAKMAAGATAIGVMVTAPEPDAVVRKMPMLIRVGDKSISQHDIREHKIDSTRARGSK